MLIDDSKTDRAGTCYGVFGALLCFALLFHAESILACDGVRGTQACRPRANATAVFENLIIHVFSVGLTEAVTV